MLKNFTLWGINKASFPSPAWFLAEVKKLFECNRRAMHIAVVVNSGIQKDFKKVKVLFHSVVVFKEVDIKTANFKKIKLELKL